MRGARARLHELAEQGVARARQVSSVVEARRQPAARRLARTAPALAAALAVLAPAVRVGAFAVAIGAALSHNRLD